MSHERTVDPRVLRGLPDPEVLQRLEQRANVATMRLRRAPRTRRPPRYAPRTCELCGEPFTPRNGTQRFCTPEHRREHARLHGPPTTTAGWRERVQALEAELDATRAQLAASEDEQ
jgi:hypothetical protein